MSLSQNGSSRTLITSSRLDTNESVLNNVTSSNPMLPRQRIQSQEDLNRIGDFLSSGRRNGSLISRVNQKTRRNTLGEVDRNPLGRLGCVFEGLSKFPHVGRRSGIGVFEDTGFVGDVEEVLVGRPGLGGRLEDVDTFFSGVVEESVSSSKTVEEDWSYPQACVSSRT